MRIGCWFSGVFRLKVGLAIHVELVRVVKQVACSRLEAKTGSARIEKSWNATDRVSGRLVTKNANSKSLLNCKDLYWSYSWDHYRVVNSIRRIGGETVIEPLSQSY